MDAIRFRVSFFFSVFLHVCVLGLGFLFLKPAPSKSVQTPLTWIEIAPVLREKKTTNSKRIVQTEIGNKIKTPTLDAFLGEHNQSVENQTVSLRKRIEMEHHKPPTQGKKSARLNKNILNKLGLEMVPLKIAHNPEERAVQEQQGLEQAQPTEVPQDYIKGLKESERTALNTKEYMFYGYFQRIRQRLDLAWNGNLREKLTRFYRGGRQLATDRDHLTRTLVTLNALGEIIRIQIIEESGTRDLDDAAVSAFNQAGPFPNPPKGIIDRNGFIQIRWDFLLKT